jgi:hypothetical protein
MFKVCITDWCDFLLISYLQVDVLNAQKTALTSQIDNKMAMLEKKMELCETCGSLLVSDDALERTQSHVTGKQHIGYGMVRDFLEEHKVMYQYIRSISVSLVHYVLICLLLICRLQRKRQGRKRGLLGRRK